MSDDAWHATARTHVREHTTVVRMNVEVAALMAAGFQISAADAGASIPADVLLAQDGRAVAIRPLNGPIL